MQSADVTIATSLLQGFQQLVEILYLIFWPLLVLSGKLLSNTFVY